MLSFLLYNPGSVRQKLRIKRRRLALRVDRMTDKHTRNQTRRALDMRGAHDTARSYVETLPRMRQQPTRKTGDLSAFRADGMADNHARQRYRYSGTSDMCGARDTARSQRLACKCGHDNSKTGSSSSGSKSSVAGGNALHTLAETICIMQGYNDSVSIFSPGCSTATREQSRRNTQCRG